MALRIRLARAGAKKQPHYRIVVADSRTARDGRFLERLGTYSPLLPKDSPERVRIKAERVKYWLERGALPSERVARFLGAAEIIAMPARRNNPNKAQPKKKAQERLAAAEAAAEAAAAAPAPAPEPEPEPVEAAPAVDEEAAPEPAEAAPAGDAEPAPEPEAAAPAAEGEAGAEAEADSEAKAEDGGEAGTEPA